MNPLRKAIIGATLVGATVAGGAVGATIVGSAGAAETTSSTTAPAATTPAAPAQGQAPPAGAPQGQPPRGPHQANGITEEVLTGDTATKVTEAAKAAVPDGTVERVETDAEGATYEAHMTKSDGTQVTVKLDDAFKVTSIENGHA